jgi:Ca2+-binding EF-hand superfamily protein
MVDLTGKSWVTAPDLRNALEDFGFYPHVNDVLLFIRRYDRDNDGRILYSDFCEAFCPKDTLSSGVLNQRMPLFLH